MMYSLGMNFNFSSIILLNKRKIIAGTFIEERFSMQHFLFPYFSIILHLTELFGIEKYFSCYLLMVIL